MSKIDLFLFVHFFLENFLLFKLSHIPFDRAWLALQNCIYDTFLGSQYIIEKVKILFFLGAKPSTFFSILTKRLGQKSIAKKYFLSLYSPSNSASNHILDIVSQRSRTEIIRPEYWPLTPYFTFFKHNTIFILENFSFNFLTVQIESYTNR
jgi:hypothetical protein